MLEAGESIAPAAIREVREETGLSIGLGRLVGLYSAPFWWGHGHHVVLFAGEAIGGTLRPQADEVLELAYFPADGLPSKLLAGQRQKILDAFNGLEGVVRTHLGAWPYPAGSGRAEIYAERDRSGLSRSEFYAQRFSALDESAIATEVPVQPKP